MFRGSKAQRDARTKIRYMSKQQTQFQRYVFNEIYIRFRYCGCIVIFFISCLVAHAQVTGVDILDYGKVVKKSVSAWKPCTQNLLTGHVDIRTETIHFLYRGQKMYYRFQFRYRNMNARSVRIDVRYESKWNGQPRIGTDSNPSAFPKKTDFLSNTATYSESPAKIISCIAKIPG